MSAASRIWSYMGLSGVRSGSIHPDPSPKSSIADDKENVNREGSVISQIWSFTRQRIREDRAGSATSQLWPSSTSLKTDPIAGSSQAYARVSPSSSEPKSRLLRAIQLPFILVWTVLVTVAILVYSGFSKLICDFCWRERSIANDIILVTNAGRGLGRRIAVILGTKASIVVCWDPDQDRQMNTVYDIRHRGGRALGYTVDVSDEGAVNSAAKAVRRDVGCPTMIIMSSGRRPQHPLLMWTPKELEAIFRTNVLPHLVLLRTFLPDMLTNNYGHVVSIISASASAPCEFDAPYAATKVGVSELMRGLREELDNEPRNRVRVTCVYPMHTDRRPSLASIARVVVSKVLRNRPFVVVPRSSIFCLNLLRILPAPARRRWNAFFDRLSDERCESRTGRLRRGLTCGDSWTALTSSGLASGFVDFLKYAPYEMASHGSLDNVPLHLKKCNDKKIIYIGENSIV